MKSQTVSSGDVPAFVEGVISDYLQGCVDTKRDEKVRKMSEEDKQEMLRIVRTLLKTEK